MRQFYILLLFSILLAGCAPSVYYVKPTDWRTREKQDSVIRTYASSLKGWKFYVDPGHGGEDRFNHGSANDVIEADINLNVSLHLADYLRRAGATVILSRDKDTSVTLSDRPKMANASGADILISVHHNATGGKDNTTNFTSVWYHANEGDLEYHPSNHDIAKFIQRDLSYVMGNAGSNHSVFFDGTMSDYSVYPNAGFAVLRIAKIPAALIEGSFFSSDYEEQRLKLAEFNDIEAWGVFKGISRYIRAGIPRITMVSDSVFSVHAPSFELRAADSSGIDKKSVMVTIDRKEIESRFDTVGSRIFAAVPGPLINGLHMLEVYVRNKKGNAAFPFRKKILISPPVASITVTASPGELPPAPEAYSLITVKAMDDMGNACADGTVITLTASTGTISPSVIIAKGIGSAYYNPSFGESTAQITASAGEVSASLPLQIKHSEVRYIGGIVRSTKDSMPLAQVAIVSHRELPTIFSFPTVVTSMPDGKYILQEQGTDSLRIDIGREGYFGLSMVLPFAGEASFFTHFLTPIAGGVLHGKTIVIDAALGGIETGTVTTAGTAQLRASDMNLDIARRLQQLLAASGARVTLVRTRDVAMNDDERLKTIASIKEGLYLRIEVSKTDGKVGIFTDPTAARTKGLGPALQWGIAATLGRDTLPPRSERTALSDGIPFSVVSLLFPDVTDSLFGKSPMFAANNCAWGIYRGVLKAYGYVEDGSSLFMLPAGSLPPLKKAVLDHALVSVTAADGSCTFYAASNSKHVVKTLEE
ncbi:MAG: N-acetylmuramoyl-L-alanine amidase [Ignavibacteriales bacterium]|nr:N-acetylmuramoyl-L-alanine amidase [Ignavibacteriales bacterium]